MVIAWIGYCLVVSALLGLAALAGERALGHYRRPVRGVWLAALVGSVLIPVAAYVAPTLMARFATVKGAIPIGLPDALALDEITAGPAAGLDGPDLLSAAGTVLGAVWLASVIAFAGHLAITHRRLRREMSGWTPGEILDAPVMMTHDRGPAVVGLGRGVIVMPAWISELEEDVLRLVFLHEREHVLAGDNRLFSLGLLGIAAMPWNPIAWWQLRRLRLAIEFDCDRRVMARGIQPREYAEALLAVGGRLTSTPLATVGFAERRPAVERRLRRMTEPLRRLRGPRAAAAVGVSALAVVFACGSPLPTDRVDPAGPEAGVVPTKADAPDPGVRLLDTTEPLIVIDGVIQAAGGVPDLDELDVEHVEIIKADAARSLYGDRARDGVVNITTKEGAAADPGQELPSEIRKRLSESGEKDGSTFRVDKLELEDMLVPLRAGAPTADRPDPLIVIDGVIQADGDVSALKKTDIDHVEVIKGEAARDLYGARAANGVVQITTKEAAGDGQAAESRVEKRDPGPPDGGGDGGASQDASGAEPYRPPPSLAQLDNQWDRPAFIPYDKPPKILNVAEMVQAVIAAYPGHLRDGGIEGRVEVWLYIDANGAVADQEVKTSSGNQELDAAAAEALRLARFSPAVNRDRPTAVWVSQWVTFEIT